MTLTLELMFTGAGLMTVVAVLSPDTLEQIILLRHTGTVTLLSIFRSGLIYVSKYWVSFSIFSTFVRYPSMRHLSLALFFISLVISVLSAPVEEAAPAPASEASQSQDSSPSQSPDASSSLDASVAGSDASITSPVTPGPDGSVSASSEASGASQASDSSSAASVVSAEAVEVSSSAPSSSESPTEVTASTEVTDVSTESSLSPESSESVPPSLAPDTPTGAPAVGGGPAAAVEGLLEGGGPVAALQEDDLLQSLGVQGEMKYLENIGQCL